MKSNELYGKVIGLYFGSPYMKNNYVKYIEEKLDIDIDPDRCKSNLGMNQISKVCLNSPWRKNSYIFFNFLHLNFAKFTRRDCDFYTAMYRVRSIFKIRNSLQKRSKIQNWSNTPTFNWYWIFSSCKYEVSAI